MLDYVKQAMVTAPEDYALARTRLESKPLLRLLHAAMGVSTEAGEFMDLLKRAMFYGQLPSKAAVIEELGDLFWYIAVAADVMGVSFEEIQSRNIAKLRARYPEKFNEDDALNRDHKAEAEAFDAELETYKDA